MLLAATSGMTWPWFGPIANDGMWFDSIIVMFSEHSCSVSTEFGFTLDQINWFSNTVNFVYLPVSVVVPMLFSRYGISFTVSQMPMSVVL